MGKSKGDQETVFYFICMYLIDKMFAATCNHKMYFSNNPLKL